MLRRDMNIRQIAAASALALVAALAFGGTAYATSPTCEDFTNWADANAAYDEGATWLDGDLDGVPCESLPGAPLDSEPTTEPTTPAPTTQPTVAPTTPPAQTTTAPPAPTTLPTSTAADPVVEPVLDCDVDFATWAEAKAAYDSGAGYLDGNEDGVPCENLLQVVVVPVGGVDTGDGSSL